jgi:hypothetical protein
MAAIEGGSAGDVRRSAQGPHIWQRLETPAFAGTMYRLRPSRCQPAIAVRSGSVTLSGVSSGAGDKLLPAGDEQSVARRLAANTFKIVNVSERRTASS